MFQIVYPQIDYSSKGLKLIVIIPQSSYPDCLEYEIPNLKELKSAHESKVNVYLMAKDGGIANRYNFNYNLIHPSGDIFEPLVGVSNPVALLVDETGNIHSAYMAEIGNKDKSDKFYSKMSYLLSII